ncbi:hypothetical protein ACLQ2Q_13345 [Microbacterium sp. DT81.1]|uniref:hypothetical protein n=1 Tax=Microbacterium sp. DT81.1 TaxID=3393413 RepID=UPI003CE8E54E
MRRVVRFSLALLFAAASLAGGASAAAAPPDGVTIEFTPNELTAVRGERITVALSIENGSDMAITQLRVGDVRREDVTVVFDQESDAVGTDASASIPGGGSLVVRTDVTVVAQLPGATTLVAEVTYRLGDIVRHDVATLKITPGTWPTAPAGPLTVSSQGPANLVDTGATDLIFSIRNSSTAEQTIESAIITYPEFLVVGVSDEKTAGEDGRLRLADPIVVAPGGGVTLLVNVRADDGVRPGTALIVLDMSYSQVDSSTTGFASASHALTLSVFGESDVATVFSAALAPAFWIVPGILFVLVVWFLWTRMFPKKSLDITTGSGLAATAGLGIVALFPAFLFPVIYNALFNRQFPDVYGFADVIGLMLFALGAGIAVWLLLILGRQLVRTFRYEAGDSPMSLLWKMRWRTRQLNIPTASVLTEGGSTETVAVLRAAHDHSLVGPLMEVSGDEAALSAAVETRSAHRVYHALKKGRPASWIAFVPEGAAVREVESSKLFEFGTVQTVRTQ